MHVMIDLETWSTRPNAAVCEIAVLPFEFSRRGRIYQEHCFHRYVLLQDGVGAIDNGTLLFWMKQGGEGRKRLIQGLETKGVPPQDVVQDLITWPGETGLDSFKSWGDVQGVWSHGAAFDQPILENLFHTFGVGTPWHYQTSRCFRTLKAIKGESVVDATGMVEHHAPDDALYQTMQLLEIMYG